MSTPILISIEGNIGSGKSTLLKGLREAEPDWMFVDEPVDSWLNIRNDHGESLLEVFYKDIKRWAYSFQNAAVLSRGQMIREALESWQKGNKKCRIIIMERCVETDRNVFAKMLKRAGDLDNIEWTLYEKWYALITEMIPKMNSYIWIDTEPNTCFQRIKQRAREGENDIHLGYLQNLDKVHQEWLSSEESVFRSQDINEIRKYIHSLE
jgi:deoxyguanosine kinase